MKLKNCSKKLALIMTDVDVENLNIYYGNDFNGYLVDIWNGQVIEGYGFYGRIIDNETTIYKVI